MPMTGFCRTSDSGDRTKRVGKFMIGPKVGSSPVKSLQDYIVRKEGSDQFYIARVSQSLIYAFIVHIISSTFDMIVEAPISSKMTYTCVSFLVCCISRFLHARIQLKRKHGMRFKARICYSQSALCLPSW